MRSQRKITLGSRPCQDADLPPFRSPACRFFTGRAEREQVDTGDYAAATLTVDAPSIVFWVVLFGLQKEDVLELRLRDIHGQVLSGSRKTVDSTKAMAFAFVGKRRASDAWLTGTYTGQVIVNRGAHVVIDASRSVTVH